MAWTVREMRPCCPQKVAVCNKGAELQKMAENTKKNYYGYTEAKKKANEKYNAKFHEVKVRMLPERHEMVKKHAEEQGESTSAFINRAIDEQIKRDSQ